MGSLGEEGAESRVAALGVDVEIAGKLWFSPIFSPFFLFFCNQCPNRAKFPTTRAFYEVACLLCPTIPSVSPRLNFNNSIIL